MVQRTSYPAGADCEIVLTFEQMRDGWAVVASITHHSPRADRVVDLPVPSQRFGTREEAEAFGLRAAHDYLARNTPSAA